MKIKALLSNDSICWKGLCHEDIIQCRFGSILKWRLHYIVSLLAHEVPLWRYKEGIKQISSGSTNCNTFWTQLSQFSIHVYRDPLQQKTGNSFNAKI